jgi:flavin reductase (DIM6/NTAB) family NADH-FMN oxidoreductase RutF
MDAKALYKFSSGLYVVSAATQDDWGACLVNTGLQLTSDPLQVEVVINKQNHTEGVVERAGHFALCPITEEADMPYIGRFGFRTSTEFDKFEGIERRTTALGDPYTPLASAAVLACRVVQTLDVGTHVVFVGEVTDAEVLSSAAPMTYAYYHTTLKGKTPPKASSFVPGA